MYNLAALYYNSIMPSHYSTRNNVHRTHESGFIPILVLAALGIGGLLAGVFAVGSATGCDALDFGCYGIAIGVGIVKVFFGILAEVAELIYKGVAFVLGWAVRNMLSIPVAPHAPGIPDAIREGWNLSRSLVNAVLLLILVFIGLATILRFREYELQRTLPRLLIIALLVNFSGVFVGLVVDIANIIANFFFNAVSKISWAVPWPGASGVTGPDLAQIVASSLGIILYYLIAILIYLAVILALFIRIFVLWTLAILAPLAFGMYVLPATKGWWNRWLHSLLTWAFLPVPIGFFLYLAGYTLVNSVGAAFDPASGIEPNPIVAFLGPFTALFLLFVGLSISLSLAPSSVQRAIRFGEKAAMVGAGFLGAQALGRYFAREKRKREGGEDTVMQKAERMSFGIDWKNKKLQSALISVGTLGMAPAARWAMRTGIRKGVEYGAKQGADIDKKASEYEKTARSDWGLFMEQTKAPGPGFLGDTNRAAMMLAAARVKGGKGLSALRNQNADDFESGMKHLAAERPGKLMDALKHDWDLTDNEKAKEIFGKEKGPQMAAMLRERALGDSVEKDERGHTVFKRDRKGEIDDRDAQDVLQLDRVKQELIKMATAGAEQWEQDQYLMREVLAKKMADELKNTDIDNMSKRVLDNEQFRRALAQWKPWSFIRKIGEEWGAESVEKIQAEAEKMDPELKDIAKTNRGFLRASTTREGELVMRRFRSSAINPTTKRPYGEISGKKPMETFIAEATKQPVPQAPPPPTAFAQREQDWIKAAADEKFKEDPTRPLSFHITVAQREYLQKYRPKITQQVKEEDAWIKHRGIPVEERQREIFEQMRAEETMPKLTPRATSVEEQEFKQVASDLKKLPSERTKAALRKVQGAREAAFYMARQDETELARLAKLLDQAQSELTTARAQLAAAAIPELKAASQAKVDKFDSTVTRTKDELKDREDIWAKHKGVFTTLEIEESEIEAALARKVKP